MLGHLLDILDIVRQLDLLALLDKEIQAEYLAELVELEVLTLLAVWAVVVVLEQQAATVELVILPQLAIREVGLAAQDILGQLTV